MGIIVNVPNAKTPTLIYIANTHVGFLRASLG